MSTAGNRSIAQEPLAVEGLASVLSRGFGWLCLSLVVLLVASSACVAQVVDDSFHSRAFRQRFEEGVIRISVSGILSQDISAAFAGDTLFLPLSDVCELLRYDYRRSEFFDSVTVVSGAHQTALLQPLLSTMRLSGEHDEKLARGSCFVDGEQLLVEVGVAERLLQITWTWNQRRSELIIPPESTIPLVDYARNRQKYAALSLSKAEDAHQDTPVQRSLLGDLAINWSLNALTARTTAGGSGIFQIGGPLLFGTFTMQSGVQYSSIAGQHVSASLQNAGWELQFPGSAFLNRISLAANWSRNASDYSVGLSNRPLTFREYFSDDQITGILLPGWTAELYQGGTLVAVEHTDSTGHYSFPIRWRYGGNPMEIHEVGPHGERSRRNLTTLIRSELLPPGSFDYYLDAGLVSPGGASLLFGGLDTRAGISRWLSVGINAAMRPSRIGYLAPDSIAAVTSADLWFGGTSYLNLSYKLQQRSFAARLQQSLWGTMPMTLSIDQIDLRFGLFQGGFSLQVPIGTWQTGISGHLSLQRQVRDAEGDLFVAGYASRMGWSVASRLIGERSPSISQENPDAGRLRWAHGGTSVQLTFPLFSSLLIRGEADFYNRFDRPDRLAIIPSVTLWQGANLSMSCIVDSLNWRSGRFQAQLNLDLGPARVYSTADYAKGETVSATYAYGSAIIGPGLFTLLPNSAVGQSAIAVRGFHDTNLNGLRDDGEEDVGPTVGTLFSNGVRVAEPSAVYTSVLSNSEYVLEVDSWIHADQNLFPTRRRFSVYAMPSTTHFIDIPFSEGYDVTGACEIVMANGHRKSAAPIFNGLRVRLVNDSRGTEFEGEVFQDGTLSVSGVSAGTYRIELDKGQLESRRLQVQSLPDPVTIGPGNGVIPTIVFEPWTQQGPATAH